MKDSSSTTPIILLLDSDSVTRAVLRDTLESAGYLVAAATDLGTAVDRLEEIEADLLVVRPYINSMPGRLAADYLRSNRPGLPVLIVAGFMDEDRIHDLYEVAKFHTFPQPFRRDQLLAKVREVLHIARRPPGPELGFRSA